MNNLKIILRAYKESHRLEKRLIPCTLIISFITAIKPFINIWFSAKIIDTLGTGADIKSLITLIAIAVGINLILMFLNNYLSDMYFMYRSMMYNNERKSIAEKLFSTQYSILESSDFKELVHKHTEAQNRVYSAFVQLSWMLRDFISGIITIAVSAVFLIPLFKIGFTKTGETFFEKPIFLISIIIAIAIMAVIILLMSLKINKAYFEAGDEYSRLDKIFYYFLDMFSNYKTGKEIRLYSEQDIISKTAVDVMLTDGEKLLKKTSLRTAKSSSLIAIIGSMLGFGIYLFIGAKGLFGLFGIGSLVLYSGSFMQIINGVMMMANTFGKTAEMVPHVKYYFDILDTKDTMTYGDKKLNTDKAFEIEFKNVSFKYPGSSNYSLKNINLKISNGEHLAVVGRNGSGKTTFIKLMCRLYDVTEGEILINGINIKEYSKESIINLYSVVFQDFQMFSLPVSDNICAGTEYDREKMLDCLEQANIKERILDMPEKDSTYLYKDIDKNGVEISGGEAQKLALARALYKDSPVVILDEPTAALDPVAENEIYNRFNSFVKNKTAIYISHRLSSCVFCSRIAVFDNAELAETGTHMQLLENNGKYSELWNAQAQYYI